MEIILETISTKTHWLEGKFGNYRFQAKHYDEGSEFGIKNGRTSKLWVCDAEGNCVANYDRGWDVKPATNDLQNMVDEIIAFLENLPKRFSE